MYGMFKVKFQDNIKTAKFAKTTPLKATWHTVILQSLTCFVLKEESPLSVL